jgi:hypothetical protein
LPGTVDHCTVADEKGNGRGENHPVKGDNNRRSIGRFDNDRGGGHTGHSQENSQINTGFDHASTPRYELMTASLFLVSSGFPSAIFRP